MTPPAYPTAPAVHGVTFRHAAFPDDLVRMNAVANEARLAEGIKPLSVEP